MDDSLEQSTKHKYPGLRHLIDLLSPCERKQWLNASLPFHLKMDSKKDYNEEVIKNYLGNENRETFENILESLDAQAKESVPYSGVTYERKMLYGDTPLLMRNIAKKFGLESDIAVVKWNEKTHDYDFLSSLLETKETCIITEIKVEYIAEWKQTYSGEIDFVFIHKGRMLLGEIKTYLADSFSSQHKFSEAIIQMSWYAKALRQNNVECDLSEMLIACHGTATLNTIITVNSADIYESVNKAEKQYTKLFVSNDVFDSKKPLYDVNLLKRYVSNNCLSCPFFAVCNEKNDMQKLFTDSMVHKGTAGKIEKTDFKYLPEGNVLHIDVSLLPGTDDRILGLRLYDKNEIFATTINLHPENSQESRTMLLEFFTAFKSLEYDSIVFPSKKSMNALCLNINRFFKNKENNQDASDAPEIMLKIAFLGDNILSGKVFSIQELIDFHFSAGNVTYKNSVNQLKFIDSRFVNGLSYMDFYVSDLPLEIHGFSKEENEFDRLLDIGKKESLTREERILLKKSEKEGKSFLSAQDEKLYLKILNHLDDIQSVSIVALQQLSLILSNKPKADVSVLLEKENKFLNNPYPMSNTSIYGASHNFFRRESFEATALKRIIANDKKLVSYISNLELYESNSEGHVEGKTKIRTGDTLIEKGTDKVFDVETIEYIDGNTIVFPSLPANSVFLGKKFLEYSPNVTVKDFFDEFPLSVDAMNLQQVDAKRRKSVTREGTASDILLNVLIEDFTAGKNFIVQSPPGAGKTYAITSLAASMAFQKQKVAVIVQTLNQAKLLCEAISEEFALDAGLFIGGVADIPDNDIIIFTAAKMKYSQNKFNDLEPMPLLVDEAWQMKTVDWFSICGTNNWTNIVMVGDPGQIPPVNSFDVRMWEGNRYKPHVAAPNFILGEIDKSLKPKNVFNVHSFPNTRRFGDGTVDVISEFYKFPFGSSHRHEPVKMNNVNLPEMNMIVTDVDNIYETVLDTVLKLVETNSPETIGVVCSRSEDVSYMQSLLQKYPEVLVETPERWQGLERNIIVGLDPMVLPSKFSSDAHRMCVMASRHKNLFILVSTDLAQHVSEYQPKSFFNVNGVNEQLITSDFYAKFNVLERKSVEI